MLDTFAWTTLAAISLGAAGCGGKVVIDVAPGTGGAPSTSTTGAGGAPIAVPACETGALTVDGPVDAQPLHAASQLHSGGGGGGCLTFLTDGRGLLRLAGAQAFPEAGEAVSDHAWLRVAGSNVAAGHWLCSDAPTTVTLEGSPLQASFTWPSLRDLGACPGTPVDAALTFAQTGLSGTLGGAAISLSSTSSTKEGATWELHDLGECGLLEIDTSTSPPSGVMLMPPEAPDAGAVFCIGSITKAGAGFALGDVSRLGTCGEAKTVGAVGVCAGF